MICWWRPDEGNFTQGEKFLPLRQQDIYFMTGLPIWGIQEITHPMLASNVTIDELVQRNYGGWATTKNDKGPT